ncbi:unnamed protein product [Orchesella dallaii]|uniref:Uncharacterized protein n=1 Tax=Orchesella dallaii TaxID=48710 RepID=A0ABP1Q304_9HEXA
MWDFKQMYWIIPICQDEDLSMASLTAKLIKRNCSELVIALVSQTVNRHTRKLLRHEVDVVIISQEENSDVDVSRIDMLLLESLNFGTRSAAIVIKPGVLVFQTIRQVLKTAPHLWMNQGGVWMVVPIRPNPTKYELAVQDLVKNGGKFDLEFIKCNIAHRIKDEGKVYRNEAVLSWAQLKCYTGQDFPCIQLEPDVLTAMKLNTTSDGVQWDAPWQNAIFNQLASVLNPSTSPSTSLFEQNQDSWVAIVGMACRFPQANSIPEFWQVLSSGQNTASSPPTDRLGKCTLEKNMKGNFLKCPVDLYDAGFFRLPPTEVEITDVQARLLLEVSWEALEDACINPEKLRNKPVGVFHGSWIHDYKDILQDCQKSNKDFMRKYIGNGLGSAGARVSFFYGFTGPNIATDSACSSSLIAVELACKSLQNGDCPVALASGSNIILQMDMGQKVIFSQDGKCKSFDSKADGYGRGEGVAVLVLKRYADALRDGDPIHGIILGSASTQEGMSPSIGTPTVKNERATLEMALESAQLSPLDVDYVEAHATGTKVGDPIEAKAIVEAYSSQGKERISPLLIGSVKTNIGHTEACSGIASLIKVLLAMKHETIPATINIETINPKVDFSSIPGIICTEIQPWKKSSTRPRIAGISNFGITGTDAHLLVREPPLRKEAKLNFKLKTCPIHILALSAKTDGVLDQLSQSFISLLEDETRSSTIEELTYTANACRAHLLPCRRAVVGRNKEELVLQLRQQQIQTIANENEEDLLNIGFIFNTSLNYDDDDLEQHAQLYHTFPIFQIHMNYCSTLCERLSGFSPLSSILNRISPVLLRDRKLSILSANYSLYKLWESWGLAASSVVGLNFGEIIGAVVADQLSLEHGVRLIIGNGEDGSNEVGRFELNSTKITTLYISGEKGELEAVQGLPKEHWKRVCLADGDENTRLSQQQLESSSTSRASGASNNFIKVGQHGNCQLLSNLGKPGNEVKATEEKGLGSILSTLGSLYEAGYVIDWEGFYMHRPCTKVSLPHYPFQRKSYWFKYELKRQRDMEPLSSRPTLTQQQTNHPLLGSYLAPDSKIDADLCGSQILNTFETFLSPQEKAPYLSAHMIGTEIIFPAAAFLELLLAARSFQSRNKKGFPHSYILENFHVHHPLRLLPTSQTSLRTVMTKTETDVSAWSVFAETGRTDKELNNSMWKQHATCDTSHIEPVMDEQGLHDIADIKKRALYIENGHTMFYNGIGKVGLNFGNEFKSLEEIYHQKSETLAQVPIPQDASNYICHPLLSDAMIQCYIFHQRQLTSDTALQVPVSIGKFVCHRLLSQAECWGFYEPKCHVYFNAEKDTVYLLDSEGYTLATMRQLELATTTVNSILKAAGVSINEIPEKERAMDSFETVWKPDERHQVVGSRCVKDGDFTTSPDYISLVRSLEQRNRFTKLEKEQDDLVNRLCELFVLKAFYEMGWKPKLGQTFNVLELANELEISDTFLPAFRHFISYFVDNGVLRAQSDTANLIFQIENLPETYEKVEENIEKISASLSSYRALKFIKSSGTSLGPCLQGKVKGQQILFGSEDADGLTPAAQYYKINRFYSIVARSAPNVFLEISKNMWSSLSSLGGDENSSEKMSRPIIRILEVGAGTGTFTKDALSLLEYEGIDFQYYFTDISFSFLKKAETLFAEYDGKISYSTLDVEKDPLEQGFPPSYFDVVVGLDVLHATEDLRRTLGFIQKILKTGGKLLIGETNIVIKEFDVVFGIVSGYWKFKDYDLRPTHCIISAAKWAALLRDVGFRGPSSQILSANNNHCVVVATLSQQDLPDVEPSNEISELGIKNWLLFHDFQEDGTNFKLVSGIRRRMAELGRHVHPHFVHQLTELSSSSSGTSSFLKEITSHTEGILCLIQGEDSLAENNCRAILEPLLVTSKHLLGKRKTDSSIVPKVFVVTLGLWSGGEEGVQVWSPSSSTLWGFIRCIRMELPGLVSKLVDLDYPSDLNEKEKALNCLFQELWLGDDETEVVYRQGGRYCRRLKKIPIISDNLLLPIPNTVCGNFSVELPQSNLLSDVSYVSKLIEDVGENEVVVEVRAAALNFRDIFSIMKPSDRFRDLNTIGIDFSGVVTNVGRKVTGLNIGTPVFGIALKDSTITGYIQVPAQLLAVVPPTISFREAASVPVAFLTAWYCLVNVAKASPDQTVLIHAASGGVGLIAIQIAKLLGLRIVATAGNLKKRNYLSQLGIQHVFNSRTLEYGERIKEITNGKGVDIVLNCLTGPGFKETSLEICKVGGHFVEMSKLEIWEEGEVAERKPGVNYTIVDLPTVDPVIIFDMLKRCSALLESGSLCPGPITYFTASRLVPALQFLQKAKHIGKVVVGMPLFEPETGMWMESLFSERSTYLITGGMGAIGLAIAAWMVSRGAKYLIIMGRSPPKESAKKFIQAMEEGGARILSMEGDISELNQVRKVLQDIQMDPTFPPLRGVHHCAGVLSDRMLVHQDWDNFECVMSPKVKGAYNLHTLTLDTPLEFFVVHSSMISTLGHVGQANYAAGSAYLEALIEKRCWMGLPGMCVNWGVIDAGLGEKLEINIMNPASLSSAVEALELYFLENRSVVIGGILKFDGILKLMPVYKDTLFEYVSEQFSENDGTLLQQHDGDGGGAAVASLVSIYFNAKGEEEKQLLITSCVKNQLSETLCISSHEVREGVQFSRMGLDSLLSIEFYNRLQRQMGKIDLGYIDMESNGTLEQITELIRNAFECSVK